MNMIKKIFVCKWIIRLDRLNSRILDQLKLSEVELFNPNDTSNFNQLFLNLRH